MPITVPLCSGTRVAQKSLDTAVKRRCFQLTAAITARLLRRAHGLVGQTLGLVLLFVTQAPGIAATPVSTTSRACGTSAGVTSICGLNGPEDIELTPDGKSLITSDLPGDWSKPHGTGLMIVDLTADRARPLPVTLAKESGWGADDCQSPPAGGFTTHGISLSTRVDGRIELLAVNHADRESIEFFEIIGSGATTRAVWHGCAPFPTGLFNDVVATPGGGFIAAVMLDKALLHGREAPTVLFSSEKAGYLTRWTAKGGYVRLPGSEAALNNSLQLGADGTSVYFTAYTGKRLLRYDLIRQKISGSTDVNFYPDDITKSVDGTLLVTGIDDLAGFITCTHDEGHFCDRLVAFTVVRLDPRTMATQPVYHGKTGMLAGASVALKVGDRLYISTYTGDRMLSMKMPRLPALQ